MTLDDVSALLEHLAELLPAYAERLTAPANVERWFLTIRPLNVTVADGSEIAAHLAATWDSGWCPGDNDFIGARLDLNTRRAIAASKVAVAAASDHPRI